MPAELFTSLYNTHMIVQICVRANVAVQFRIAYDCYLEIMRSIRDRVQTAIGIDSLDSHTRSLCPPCSYELKDALPLHPKKLFSMDGNNSLKLMDSVYRAGELRSDDRTVASHRWIEDHKVNNFKDEVKRRPPVSSFMPGSLHVTDI